MAKVELLLFASAREAAGTARGNFDADDLGELLQLATTQYGDGFRAVLATARVWRNGDEPTNGLATALADGDEIAVLPPVSGG